MSIRAFLWLSVAAALTTIALKSLAWWFTGSVGLLSDALESFVNLAGATFALLMVSIASRPADAGHPYGHHKAEYFSSGFEGILILGVAVAIIAAAVDRWLHPQPLETLGLGLTLSVVASIVNAALSVAMRRAAHRHRSVALEADARHLMSDVWTTCGVVVGLVAASFTGWLWLDALLAIAVALNILREGLHLVSGAVQGLMDQALGATDLEAIERTLERFTAEAPVRFDHVVSRRAGQRSFVDLHMHMPADWSLGRAATLRGSVERALGEGVPGLRASIQMLPFDVEPMPLQARPGP